MAFHFIQSYKNIMKVNDSSSYTLFRLNNLLLLLWFEKMGLFYLKSPLMEKGMSEMFVDVKIGCQNSFCFISSKSTNFFFF